MNTTHVLMCLGLAAICTCAFGDTFGDARATFDIDFVTIQSPGNLPDTMEPDPGFITPGNVPLSIGSVSYVYRIARYETSREMITIANELGQLGITFKEDITQQPRPSMPAVGISWSEAARVVNWMNETQGYPPAYKFAKKPGDNGYVANAVNLLWEDTDPGFSPQNRFRNSLAKYYLPDFNEWHKAAYFDPLSGSYLDYPGGNTPPVRVASGTLPNTAVYDWGDELFDVPLSDVSLAGGPNQYGIVGLGGNAWEFEETEWHLENTNGPLGLRAIRGGSRGTSLPVLRADNSRLAGGFADYEDVNLDIGFRIASVPEASHISAMLGWGLAAVALVRRRRNPIVA